MADTYVDVQQLINDYRQRNMRHPCYYGEAITYLLNNGYFGTQMMVLQLFPYAKRGYMSNATLREF